MKFSILSTLLLATISMVCARKVDLPNCPPRPITHSDQRAIFADFRRKFYIDKNATSAINDHLAEDYIQHNPNVLSGRQNALDSLGPVLALFNTTIVNFGFDANVGWVHYKLEFGPGPYSAVVDVFRFNGSCIQEHWDVAQTRPENATNPLALF
ncbi:snoal-like polyketide cyclase family protein [Phlyctema vagabunda]|uniref:Snoal-like polyketide cyclase family protein n=1 Tax=Phlyctema vagabunda TaxID=108571 RepID=A0ABR4PKZ6_9HELO